MPLELKGLKQLTGPDDLSVKEYLMNVSHHAYSDLTPSHLDLISFLDAFNCTFA